MITQEFKDQMRKFLISAFDNRDYILYTPWSLGCDMSFDDNLFMIRAPIIAGGEILDFFREEGLKVDNIGMGLFRVSLAL